MSNPNWSLKYCDTCGTEIQGTPYYVAKSQLCAKCASGKIDDPSEEDADDFDYWYGDDE